MNTSLNFLLLPQQQQTTTTSFNILYQYSLMLLLAGRRLSLPILVLRAHLSTAFNLNMSGINTDGTLKKFAVPKPTTPISIAASTGDVATLSSIEHKPNLWTKDEYGNIPLIWAADKGHIDVLQCILSQNSDSCEGGDKDGCNINTRGYLGNTAIARAARGGHLSCVKLLLEQHRGNKNDGDGVVVVDPNICNEKKQYPLHFAAFKKHPEVVKVLLDSGLCDTLVKDRKGRTPAEDTSVEAIRDMILEYRVKNQQ